MKLKEHFDKWYREKADEIDVKLFDSLYEVETLAVNECKKYEEQCAKELSEELRIAFGSIKVRNMLLGQDWGYITIINVLEGNDKIYTLHYKYDPKSNNLLKVLLYEDEWQNTIFENSLGAHQWGFQILHHFDINVSIRKIIEKYIGLTNVYHKIWFDASDQMTEIICKYEK